MFFIVIIMYFNYELPLSLVNSGYDFRQHDMVVNFFFTYSEFFDYTMLLIVYAFAVFIFLLEYWCFRLDVASVGRKNWRFWWQLTVVNLDQYYECHLKGTELKRVNDLKRQHYERIIDKTLGRLSFKYFAAFPVVVKKPVAWVLAKVDVVFHLEDINVARLQSNPLSAIPALSWKVRKRTLQYMIVTELFATASQVFLSKFLLLFLFIM